ncbi:IclR family transcriptional regulator [Streptomyces sp. SL13]|uniref:Glycerol operon regulatory protein n=1 Tax=Streptantibioticus silvisoli TaxID=2705255 RepID=A0AA90HBW2_9ACTN|nr:IclR family transcriptional regulator [Streptantibioticus silvisoli]MDI5963787.1 IclR family transcriptional regulator [Streptantibioticus silvisoli]MDI5972830.1 IclR family transcriptional regulator [Streptantibioticus silvisoli]
MDELEEPQQVSPRRQSPGRPASTSSSSAVKSADRTVELLELLARVRDPLTLSEIHRELGYPKSSLFVLLHTLVARGWVETDRRGTGYFIGLHALLVGTSYLDRDPVIRAATRTLEQLRTEVNETCHLARLEGPDVVYLASRESAHHLRLTSRVGRRLPAHATALGKALLARRSDQEVLELLPETLVPLTAHTITDRDALLAELAETRARGYSAEQEQNTEGLGCFAVALDHGGPVVDAISCSVPLARLKEGDHAAQVLDAVQRHAGELCTLLRMV